LYNKPFGSKSKLAMVHVIDATLVNC